MAGQRAARCRLCCMSCRRQRDCLCSAVLARDADANVAVLVERRLFGLRCRRFGDPRLVLDTGYNLMWALHTHSYDADCAIFLKVVQGEACRWTLPECHAAVCPSEALVMLYTRNTLPW